MPESASHALALLGQATTMPAFVTADDVLRIRSYNSLAGVELRVEGRIVLTDGRVVPFSERHAPNSDRSEGLGFVTLAEGLLAHVSVRVSSGAPTRGRCFVIVEIVRGRSSAAQSLAPLVSDYVTANCRAGWPGGVLRSSLEGPGWVRAIASTDPAAGVEISETVPTGARWRPLSLDAPLVTDATVANRDAVLTIDDGANILAESATAANQAASLTRRYSFMVNTSRGAAATAALIQGNMPELLMAAGFRIRTVTTNLQAGDNWGAPFLLVEEWLDI